MFSILFNKNPKTSSESSCISLKSISFIYNFDKSCPNRLHIAEKEYAKAALTASTGSNKISYKTGKSCSINNSFSSTSHSIWVYSFTNICKTPGKLSVTSLLNSMLGSISSSSSSFKTSSSLTKCW